SDASVLGSSSTIRRCAISRYSCRGSCGSCRKLDAEGGTPALFAFYGDPPAVVADHGLHDGEAEAGAVGLGGVVWREQARALLRGQSLAGVGDFQAHSG